MQINVNGNLDGKKVSVIGLGRSGLSAAKLLSALGAEVWISDSGDNIDVQYNLKKIAKLNNIHIETGKHTENFIKGSEFIVVSPGVNKKAEPIAWSARDNIPIISEIELGFLFCPAKIIAVTGTNGKTTVVSLVTSILQQEGLRVFALGNIGNPFCGNVLDLNESDLVVLEVSTFQLEWIDKFKPRVSVVLNISRNHLDRHKDMLEYTTLKKRIFSSQTEHDFTVLNRNDPVVEEFANHTKAKLVFFESSTDLNANEAAAMAVASIFNIKEETCREVFKNFKGIEHRLEYVDTIKEVDFINDSKATTTDATLWALKNTKKPVILIAGGKDKGADFRQIRPHIKNSVKNIILIGEAKDLIRFALEDIVSIKNADSLEEATEIAFNLASKGDCVLLSPMCASFDMFSNFEERGEIFKSIVKQIRVSRNL